MPTPKQSASSSSPLNTGPSAVHKAKPARKPATSKKRGKWPSGKRIKIKEFTLFPRLPLELRQMIFHQSAKQPRMIKIEARERANDGVLVNMYRCETYYRAVITVGGGSEIPALLHVCSEAREVAFELFEIVYFRDDSPPIYINYDLDTLYFPRKQDVQVLSGVMHCFSRPRFDNCRCRELSPFFNNQLDELVYKLKYVVFGYYILNSALPESFSLEKFRSLKAVIIQRRLRPTNMTHGVLDPSFFVQEWNELEQKPEIQFVSRWGIKKLVKACDVKVKHAEQFSSGESRMVAKFAELEARKGEGN